MLERTRAGVAARGGLVQHHHLGFICSGYIRLSLHSQSAPLYANFPVIFTSCFSKVIIGFIPNRTAERRSSARATPNSCLWPCGGQHGSISRLSVLVSVSRTQRQWWFQAVSGCCRTFQGTSAVNDHGGERVRWANGVDGGVPGT